MNAQDSIYINRLRGASILRVVLGHLGLGWILLPYSSYIGVFLSILFFCSGYVFIYLFNRSKSVGEYIYRRMLGVVLPFYLVYLFSLVIFILMGSSSFKWDWYKLFQILIIAPDIKDMPYPLGQIWYLRVLVFCTLVSPIFFLMAKKSIFTLLLPVLIAVIFASIQLQLKFHRTFFYFGHNLFQEILYGAYFFIGAFVYNCAWRKHKIFMFSTMLVCIATSMIVFHGYQMNSNLAHHAYAPNLFYFSLGVAGIMFTLAFVDQIEWLFRKMYLLAKLMDFCGKHSYGIYLNHSFFIVFYEDFFGLKGVYHDPLLALTKVMLVVFSSFIFAMPITYAARAALSLLKGQSRNIHEKSNVRSS